MCEKRKPVETIELKDGRIVKIYFDSDPINPREEYDNLCTMVCWSNRHNLGDEHETGDPMDYWRSKIYHFVPFETDDLKDATVWKIVERYFFVLPLYLYDHSGITISTGPFSDPWDSGQIGWIFVEKKKVREEYGVKRITKQIKEKVGQIMKAEVKVYDDYLTGQVYGYVIKDKDGEENDSCWGFYGSNYKTNGIADYVPELLEI